MKYGARAIATVVIVAVYFFVSGFYNAFKGSIEAAAAIQQTKNSIPSYVFGEQMAKGNLIPGTMVALLLVLLGLVWWKPIAQLFRNKKNGASAVLGFIIFAGIFFNTGCGPAEVQPLETVGPNETAFVIPMEGDSSNQAKFESVDFLTQHKVLSKRITIPVRERSIGRMYWDYEWIPTVRVIKVDRSLVTREWTLGAGTGTTTTNQALSVASLDGINFHLGVNLTASITEEDAPVYLYWHGPKTLSDVVDTNIRGYLQGIMADEFGKLKIEQCKSQKAEIFKQADDMTKKKFKAVGITISYVGSAEGFMYDDSTIQNKINETQTAEMAVQVAAKKALEQVELNKATVSAAVAAREAAQQFAMAAEAQKAKTALDIDMVRAHAELKFAENLPQLHDQLPSVIPDGANMFYPMDNSRRQKPQH